MSHDTCYSIKINIGCQQFNLYFTGRNVLSNVTRDTLPNYYHHLHGVPRHNNVYPNYYQQPPPDYWNPNQQAPPVYSRPRQFLPIYGDKPYALPQHSPSTTDLLYTSQCRMPASSDYNNTVCRSKSDSALNCMADASSVHVQTVANEYCNPYLSATVSSTNSNGHYGNRISETTLHRLVKHHQRINGWSREIQELIAKLLEFYGPYVVDELMQSPEFPNNALAMVSSGETPRYEEDSHTVPRVRRGPSIPMTSRQPIWPPGPTYTVNTKTMQIQERGQLNTNLWSDGPEQPTSTNCDKVDNLRRPYECTFNTRKSAHLPPISYYDETTATNRVNQYKLTQPRYEPDCMDTHITPLQSYLHPTGNRVSDRLGTPYKSMAQRR